MGFLRFNHENRRVANFHYHFRNQHIKIRSVKEIVGLQLSEVYPLL